HGNLGSLSPQQRVEYMQLVCKSLGLNPFTKPIRFLKFQNEVQAYFTRDGTDQLRKLHEISLKIIDTTLDAGVFTVRVAASMPSGRTDEDVGAVVLPTGGESRANAVMKAHTKGKRRVTLSICGLGFMSEDDLDGMPGARTFDADQEPPPSRPVEPRTDATDPLMTLKGDAWQKHFYATVDACTTMDDLHRVQQHAMVRRILEPRNKAPSLIVANITDAFKKAHDRIVYPVGDIPVDDAVAELIAEIAQMDLEQLNGLKHDPAW